METTTEQLQESVEHMHHCRAQLLGVVPVEEFFQGRTVWQGIVHIFGLIGHPSATRCYAWSALIGEGDKRRFYAVLHLPPITSPQDAVRAGIVQEYRTDTPRT